MRRESLWLITASIERKISMLFWIIFWFSVVIKARWFFRGSISFSYSLILLFLNINDSSLKIIEFISEIPYGTKAYIAYDLGAWAIAYLISIVDLETYRVDFYNSLNEHGWEESFIINFNMTSNEFLIDFHEFLNLSIEEQLSIIP